VPTGKGELHEVEAEQRRLNPEALGDGAGW